MLKIRFSRLGIDYDKGYGTLNKNGWSFLWKGCYAVEMERWFIVGLVKFLFHFQHTSYVE